MKALHFPADFESRRGNWKTRADIAVTNIKKRDIYRSSLEPSYVSWAILWKESSGALKLSFVEATGDQTAWPPVYNFNSRDIEYYLKTLVSCDSGETWTDTGWREDLDPIWELNPDHHIRHVFELPDGSLMRNYCHTVEGVTKKQPLLLYDEAKEKTGDFPFSRVGPPCETHSKFSSIWTSADGGRSWKEIYLFDKEPPFFITAIHALRDGRIVALGAAPGDPRGPSTATGALTESRDGGQSWSEPVAVAENDDLLCPEGIGEECDFVELDDGRLLLIWRTDASGSCMRQMTLWRDSGGAWQASPAAINPFLVHSGYPYMHRASDGTIFYYCHTSIKYSCDNGASWGELPPGLSYYGQLMEVSPGRILAVTQMNIGDCSYPWIRDASMLQTTFDYRRTGVACQLDPDTIGALATLDVGEPADFHVALELRSDAACGLAYQVSESGYRFAAITMPANDSRLPDKDKGGEQNAFLVVGKVEGGRTDILRNIFVGKAVPGSWAELQVTRRGELLKTAARLPAAGDDWGSIYACVRDEDAAPGPLALFTNKSAGAFRSVRFAPSAGEIRSNWALS